MRSLRSVLLVLLLAASMFANGAAQRVPKWKLCDTTQMQYSYTMGPLLAAALPDDIASIGEATGSNKSLHVVRRSTDSGATWKPVYSEQVKQGSWRALVHPTTSFYAVTGDSVKYLGKDKNGNTWKIYWPFMLVTRDGGISWSEIKLDSNVIFRDMTMLNGTYGAAILLHTGNVHDSLPYALPDSLLLTKDGWKTWNTIPGPRGVRECQQVFCFAEGVFALRSWPDAQDQAFIYKTTDAGKTWTKGAAHPWVGQMTFINQRLGWGVGTEFDSAGRKGLVIKTTDGGASWEKIVDKTISHMPFGGFYSVAFSDSLHGIVGGMEFYQTEDGGKTWTIQNPPFGLLPSGPFSGIEAIVMPRQDLALAIYGSAILRYTGRSSLAAPVFHAHNPWPIPIAPTIISWTPVAGALNYELRLATVPPSPGWANVLFDQSVLDIVVPDTAFTLLNPLAAAAYYGFVRALNGADTSDWTQSGDWQQILPLFNTVSKPGLAKPLVFLTPTSGSHAQPSVRLTWSRVAGASGYEVAYDADAFPPVTYVSSTDTTVMINGLKPGTEYFFVVRAYIPDDSTDWSQYIYLIVNQPSGVAQPSANPIRLVPNPASDKVHLDLQGDGGIVQISVYDQVGHQVSVPARYVDHGADLEVHGLPSGIYTVVAGGRSMRMVVKH